MINGKTESGFEFQIEDDKWDDYELLENLLKSDKDPACLFDFVDMFLGIDQRDRLKEHLRARDGKVAVTAIKKELSEIMEASENESTVLKNS